MTRDLYSDSIGPTYSLNLIAALKFEYGNDCLNSRGHIFGLVKRRQLVVVNYDLSVREILLATLAVRSKLTTEVLNFSHCLSAAIGLGNSQRNYLLFPKVKSSSCTKSIP